MHDPCLSESVQDSFQDSRKGRRRNILSTLRDSCVHVYVRINVCKQSYNSTLAMLCSDSGWNRALHNLQYMDFDMGFVVLSNISFSTVHYDFQ